MPRTTLPLSLTDELVAQIGRIGKLRLPTEACGVILPELFHGRQVIELPNRSALPHDNYTFTVEDLSLELKPWFQSVDRERWNDPVIWHTHPKGNIGPSKADMQFKIPELSYLVVALTPEGPVPTWF